MPKPSAAIQFGAIQNNANSGSLVNQLYKGMTTKPPVIAASSAVKSPSAPQSSAPSYAPSLYQQSGQSSNYIAPQQPTSPVAPSAPTNQQITQHTVGADGSVTQKYATTPPPITGNAQTPSGATVNASTGQLVTQPPTSGGLIGNLAQISQQGSSAAQQYTSNLGNTSQTGSPAGQQYTAQTAQYGAGNIPIAQQSMQNAQSAEKAYQDAISQLEQSRLNEATGLAQVGNSPVPLEFQQGRAGVLQGEYQAQQNALASQAQAATNLYAPSLQGALSGQSQAATAANEAAGQAYTGQGQTITGLNQAAGQALTGQQLQQSGLTAAGQLALPSTAAYGQTVFNPVTGQYTGGGGLPSDVMNQYAQMAANGQYSAIPSTITSNPVLSAQLNQAASQINPNYNPITSVAQGTSAAQNTQTATTAQTNSFNGIYNTANTNAALYSQQQNAINGIGNQVMSIMSQANINPTDSQYANLKLNQVASQFSSPQYAAFNTAIQSLQARVGQALQAGEVPSTATGNAEAIANGNLKLPALAATLKQIDREMTTFVGSQQSLADYAKSQLNSGGSSGSSTNDPLGLR